MLNAMQMAEYTKDKNARKKQKKKPKLTKEKEKREANTLKKKTKKEQRIKYSCDTKKTIEVKRKRSDCS